MKTAPRRNAPQQAPKTESQPAAGEAQQIVVAGIEMPLVQALLEYLGTQPHNSVRGLIDAIQNSPKINVTLENPK